jgi:hypothetical protein
MPLISRGGGSPFNGGTITQPLVIAPTDPNSVPLSIRASWNAQNADFLAIVNTDNGLLLLEMDLNGNLYLGDHAVAGTRTAFQPGSSIEGAVAGVVQFVLGGSVTGLFTHAAAAQPSLTSGTATPEQIALALQSYGAAGGT